MATDVIQPEPKHTLDGEIRSVVVKLRAAYADLVAELPAGRSSAIEVERSLGLNKKLAWQVYRVATSRDALSAGARLPGVAAARQVAAAARKLGVADGVVSRLEALTREFHDTVQRHADDRSSFDLMVSAVTGDGISVREHDLKRSAFRANREIYGKYCESILFCTIAMPGSRPGTMHICALRGLVDLYRLRPGVQLEIARAKFDHTGGVVSPRESIDEDPDHRVGPSSILTEFCSDPLPEIRELSGRDGYTRFIAQTPSLGLTSGVTCFLADIARDMPIDDSEGPHGAGLGSVLEVSTPSKLLVHDCLIHESLFPDGEPEIRVLARRGETSAWPGNEQAPLLPVQESVTALGQGAGVCSTPEIASYSDLLTHVLERLGWDEGRFRTFRSKVEFPVIGSVNWIRFDLSGSA